MGPPLRLMRLFVAIDISEEVRRALAEACAELKPVAHNTRWVRPESLHLTVKFIGEQPEENLAAIRTALAAVAKPAAFSLGMYGLYFFPEKRFPRVLATFIHGEKGHSEMAALAKQIDFQLSPLKIPREERAYRGHLTLARLDPRGQHDALEAALAGMMRREWGEFPVGEFHLYRSELKQGGAVYTRLASFSLAEN